MILIVEKGKAEGNRKKKEKNKYTNSPLEDKKLKKLWKKINKIFKSVHIMNERKEECKK